MTKVHRILKFLKNKRVIAVIILVAIVGLYMMSNRSSKSVFESTAVVEGDVIEKVSITGAVSPMSKADLAFKKSGVISMISVKVGDSVKKGDIIASIDNANELASLVSAQAGLDEIKRGLRPEEYALYKSNLDSSQTALVNARTNAINAVLEGYVKTQSAVFNYADSFFNNPQSINPKIDIVVPASSNQDAINAERILVTDALYNWKKDNDATALNTPVDPTELVSRAEEYLKTVKKFMSNLSVIVNALNTSNSGMSQSAIDADITLMNTGLSTLTSAINLINTTSTALKSVSSSFLQASNQFDLQLAGSSSDAIKAQTAKVSSAQALLNDTRIISPIDGLVTKAEPNVGEFVNAGNSGFAVQNNSGYKIEAYIPEADIAKISIKDSATITLDAYGSYVFFSASVISIDPAETVLQGVPTYKVTLNFDKPDARIRSGMTANTDIMTNEVSGVLVVPSRAVVDDNGSKSVRVVNSDGKTFKSVPVTIGLKGSEGTTQIVSGLKVGDKVVTYVK